MAQCIDAMMVSGCGRLLLKPARRKAGVYVARREV
jgi:hypothetical protein